MSESKPVVHYQGKPAASWGGGVLLVVLDHPSFEKGTTVTTSEVISHDETTGRVETQNTIYMPVEA